MRYKENSGQFYPGWGSVVKEFCRDSFFVDFFFFVDSFL